QMDAWCEGAGDGHVDVAVDGRGDQESAERLVIRRQVGAAAAEGDAQRTAGDDHRDDESAAWLKMPCCSAHSYVERRPSRSEIRGRHPSACMRETSRSLLGVPSGLERSKT